MERVEKLVPVEKLGILVDLNVKEERCYGVPLLQLRLQGAEREGALVACRGLGASHRLVHLHDYGCWRRRRASSTPIGGKRGGAYVKRRHDEGADSWSYSSS